MNPVLLNSFRDWLISRRYSAATVRNYLVDASKYAAFVAQNYPDKPQNEIHIFSPDILTAYLRYLSGQNNSARYLASLNLFCQFAVDQQLINHNPLDQIRKHLDHPSGSSTVDQLLEAYRDYLTRRHKTPATVKNYLSDIQSYLSWVENLTN